MRLVSAFGNFFSYSSGTETPFLFFEKKFKHVFSSRNIHQLPVLQYPIRSCQSGSSLPGVFFSVFRKIGCGWIRIELVLFFLIFPCPVSLAMSIDVSHNQYHLHLCLCSRCPLCVHPDKLLHQHMYHLKAHPHYL